MESVQPKFEILTDLNPADAAVLERLLAQLDPEATLNLERLHTALAAGVTTLYAVRQKDRLAGTELV